jgi:hypothetical protein
MGLTKHLARFRRLVADTYSVLCSHRFASFATRAIRSALRIVEREGSVFAIMTA